MRDRALLIEWLALLFAALLALATGWGCAWPSVPNLFLVGRAETGFAFACGQLAGVGVAVLGMMLIAFGAVAARRIYVEPPRPADVDQIEITCRGSSREATADDRTEWLEVLVGADLPPSAWQQWQPGPLAVSVAGDLRGVVYVEIAGMAPSLWPEIGKRHDLAVRVLELQRPTVFRLATDGMAAGRGVVRVEPLGDLLKRLDLVP